MGPLAKETQLAVSCLVFLSGFPALCEDRGGSGSNKGLVECRAG